MRSLLGLMVVLLLALGCGSDDDPAPASAGGGAAGTCLPGDPNCVDVGNDAPTQPLPDSIPLDDSEGPLPINFGGFFYSDGETSRLCDSLAESFPPQCGTTIQVIEAPFEVVLEHVAESFGNPDDARISTEQGIWWTDEWINLDGWLDQNRFVLEL